MDDEDELYFQDVETLIEKGNSKQELYQLAILLEGGYSDGILEEQSVADYLDGYGALLSTLEDWYRSQGLEAPEEPTWNMMGRLLAWMVDT